MHIILIPGLWLDGSAWEQVRPALEASGHRTEALTLPGMESRDADRAAVTAQDQADSIVAAIDAAGGPVVLVGHSAGAGLAWMAVDARPDRVARAILVGGFPAVSGRPLVGGFEAVDGEVPLPAWSSFEEEELRGLDEQTRTMLRERAIPAPARVVNDAVELHDERRYEVPVTAISTEFQSAQLRTWIAAAEPPLAEFPRIKEVTYLDLDTGHWPMFTSPDELARLILQAVDRD